MKIVRWGKSGREKPGLIDESGRIRDLSGVVPDITGAVLSPKGLDAIARTKIDRLPVVSGKPRLGCCIAHVPNFYAVGLNYADHAAETGAAIPQEPILFTKSTSCLSGPNDDLVLPKDSTKTDWEVELAIVIGTRALYVSEEDALDVIAGYCLCNDISERAYQMERGGQWMKGKGFPGFGPLGPWLVTKDEIADVQNLSLWLDLNGTRVQSGSTRTMIFSVRTIVSYISRFIELLPGDVITTGTPPGVGLGMKPPRYLRPGDVMRLGIEGLGEQQQLVTAWAD